MTKLGEQYLPWFTIPPDPEDGVSRAKTFRVPLCVNDVSNYQA